MDKWKRAYDKEEEAPDHRDDDKPEKEGVQIRRRGSKRKKGGL